MYEELRGLASYSLDYTPEAEEMAKPILHQVDEHVAKQHFPKYARWEGIGRVRILEYLGDGYFRVLDKDDRKRRVHRDTLVFTKS